jgi:YVTN family beta-propeller protein
MRLVSLRRVGASRISLMALAVVVVLLASSTTSLAVGHGATGTIQSRSLPSGIPTIDRNGPIPAPTSMPLLSPPTVEDTLVLFNDSLVSGNFAAHWGAEPVAAAGDPTSGYLFVAEEIPGQVSVIAVVQSVGVEVIGTISVPGGPMGIAYDSIDGSVYVTDFGAGTVLGINGTNLTVDTTIPVGSSPTGIVFDSYDGDLYVANSGSNNVTVINGTTNATIGTGIPVGVSGAGSPSAIAFDNGTHQVFVADSSWSGHSNMPVEVINDTHNSVVATVYVGDDPLGLAYDPYDSDVYAANEGSDNLTVIADGTDSVVGNYSGFDQPSGDAYLPAQHEIDVADSGNDSVSSFYPVSGTIQDNTTVGGDPIGVVYVPFYGTGFPLVLNYATANISLLDDGSAYVDYNIRLAQAPEGIAYAPYGDELFSVNYLYSGTVDLINDTINRFPPAQIAVGHFPVGVAYDAANAAVYITNSGSNTVSVVSAFNNSYVSTIPVGNEPWGVTYDPANGEVWVANAGSDNVSVIDGYTNKVVGTVAVPANSTPQGIAYDGATGFIYVTEAGLDQVALINASSQNFTGTLPAGDYGGSAVYDSDDHLVYVANELSNNVTVYDQTTGSNAHVVANVSVPDQPYGLAYDPTTDEVFVSQYGEAQVAVIQASTESVQATVAVGADPSALAVDTPHSSLYVNNFVQGTTSIATIPIGNSTPIQEFDESGLPSGGTWYVNITGQPSLSATVNGGAGTTIDASLAAGNYTFTAATSSKSWLTSAGGAFTVGATGNTPIPVGFSAVTYTVYANETGLPVGATWYFNVTGQPSVTTTLTGSGVSSAEVDLQNGTYSWSVATNWANYTTATPTGDVPVDGAPSTVTVTFVASVPGLYFVSFDESALPVGTTWFVNITGEPSLSTTVAGSGTSSVSTSLGNGTYTYAVATNSASWLWNDSSSGTSFQVSGAPRTVALQFGQIAAPPQFAVTFSETGLPSGDRFTVLVDGQNLSMLAPSTLVIRLPNGTYSFTVANSPPYAANLTSGKVVVEGHALSIAISFANSTSTPSPSGSSSAFPWTWVILGVVIIIVALLVLFFLLAGRRRKKEEPPIEPSPSGTSAARRPGPGDGSG